MPETGTSNAANRRNRFLRVATRRTKRVLEDIRRLAFCANRAAYQYTPEDIQKIFTAIDHELALTRARFDAKEERKEVQFSLLD